MTLPNFLICGAPKAGTTALYHLLEKHPDVLMSKVKETDFFQHNYSKGIEWFESHFKEYSGERAIGEASPGNMAHPEAAMRIAKHIPQAKLIFVLRNPIERAYSQYLYGIYRGTNSPCESFSSLIRDKSNSWGQRIIELGMYDSQIARFEKYFEQSQLKIILHEDLRKNPTKTLYDIYNFIGVESNHVSEKSTKYNETRYPKNMMIYRLVYFIWEPLEKNIGNSSFKFILDKTKKTRGILRRFLYQERKGSPPQMKKEDRKYLSEVYRFSNKNLEKRLNRDLSHWK
jgi:hypothetical protein